MRNLSVVFFVIYAMVSLAGCNSASDEYAKQQLEKEKAQKAADDEMLKGGYKPSQRKAFKVVP